MTSWTDLDDTINRLSEDLIKDSNPYSQADADEFAIYFDRNNYPFAGSSMTNQPSLENGNSLTINGEEQPLKKQKTIFELDFKNYYDFMQRDNLYPEEIGKIPENEFLPGQMAVRQAPRKRSSLVCAYKDDFLRFSFMIQRIVKEGGFYVKKKYLDPSSDSEELAFVASPYTVKTFPKHWLVFNIRINKGQKRWMNKENIDPDFIYILQ
jgi:hypothetical protein